MESSETSIAQAFWFIGMMVAIAVLILFLIVVCFFKRSRGEKYHGKHTVEISILTFIFVSVYESLVTITYGRRERSDQPVHPHSLARGLAPRTQK